ncbi:hypothetical protein NX801_28865 [Streptomyces sp. LP05-1]|uniref:Uncharacterized protein n=1 Tax=Streptomyces pyxinae TaxID=2970734 RepID=A0ABT2CQN0_9ACTN|nr:hypothetical protein [Streptomyces sp. LP05-1]MCS0639576.1 hypothetical protein [Streptomyces sp. LP05-1]
MSRTGTTASTRRALRREVVSTLGLVADAQDFATMRRYRTFTHDDHRIYLRQAEALLKSLAGRGGHTTVALFDPDDYAEFCAETGLDPDAPGSRGRYTAELAATGACVAYTGQPMDELVPALVHTVMRHTTWQYASRLLGEAGICADCGQDIGRAAFDHASELLTRLLDAAGPGTHHLVCSVPARGESLVATLRTDRGPAGPAHFDSSEGAEFVTVLATGVALDSPGGLVLRTSEPGAPDHVHGWRLERGRLAPLAAAEVFNAYCTDVLTGEPVPPEAGVEHLAGFDLAPGPEWPGHPHH